MISNLREICRYTTSRRYCVKFIKDKASCTLKRINLADNRSTNLNKVLDMQDYQNMEFTIAFSEVME